MDEYNNARGREIGKQADREGWSDDRVADEVKRSIDNGVAIRDIQEARQRQVTAPNTGDAAIHE